MDWFRPLMSVYYHVHLDTQPVDYFDNYVDDDLRSAVKEVGQTFPEAEVMELAPALEELGQIQGQDTLVGQFVARRALTKLAAVELLQTPGAEDLLNGFGLGPTDFPPVIDPAGGVPLPRIVVENRAYSVITAAMGMAPTCDIKLVRSGPPFRDKVNNVLTVGAEVEVGRPFKEAVVALDPQSWKKCNVMFNESFVIAQDGNGNYDRRNPVAAADPPEKGTGWKRMFYEEFGMIETVLELRNVLAFDIEVDDTRQFMKFMLNNSVGSDMWWSELDGGLIRDDGYSIAEKLSDSQTRVTGIKHLKFEERPGRDGPALSSGTLMNFFALAYHASSDFEFDFGLCCGGHTEDS